jgi:hypothetical protein
VSNEPAAFLHQKFCEDNFKIEGRGHEYRWFDTVCLLTTTTKKVVARIALRTFNSMGGLELQLIHSENGQIDWKFFQFADYLAENPAKSNPPGVHQEWNQIGWFGEAPSPEALVKFMAAIVAYVRTYEYA